VNSESRLVAGAERVPVEQVGLERGKEALGDGVVEGVAAAALLGITPASCIVVPKARLVCFSTSRQSSSETML
jgi:hypothetical protein